MVFQNFSLFRTANRRRNVALASIARQLDGITRRSRKSRALTGCRGAQALRSGGFRSAVRQRIEILRVSDEDPEA